MASPAEFGSTREHFVDALGPHIIDGASVSKNGNGGDGTDAGVGDATAPGGQVMLFQGMSFYLNRDSSANDSVSDAAQLHQLIESHGGLILGEIPKGSTPQNTGNLFVVSPYNDTRLPTVTPTYIRACCQNNALLEIENYLVPFDEFRSVIDTQLQNEGKDQQAKIEQQEHQVQREQREQQEQRLLQEQEQIQRQRQRQGQEQEHGKPLVEVEDKPDRQGVVSPRQGSSDSYDSTRSMLTRTNMPTHNKASFTEAEDEFILDVVRKNPTRRTTHTLYDEISHYVPNHTGNSIRHRFRVYLSKRLEFVYEVDKYGKLVRDENGSLVRTKVLPPSIKKKFTAGEDYQLATGIKKQFYRDLYQIDPDTGVSLITDEDSPTAIAKRNMTMDPNHVPGTEPSFQDYRVNDRRGPIAREFFKQFGESHPTHTENAWRDRFRKFLLSYGIDNYIHYYEREIGHGNDPEPMKNLTNRVKRPGIPTPGNYNSATKRARITGSESRSSQTSGSSVNSSSAAATAAAAAAAAEAAATAAAAASQGNVPGSTAHLEAANAAAHYAIPESELLDEDTMNFISSLKNDLTKVDNSIPFEYPQEIAEAIRNDFSNEEAQYDNIDPDSIPFPPEVASIDLFLPQFFRMSSTREFLGKVHEVISRDYEPSQAEKLVQDLCDEAGVRKTFSTSILTALSGDLMVFPRYFLNMFKYNTNPPANVPGIWTREDDRMLRSSKEDDLRALAKKHGSGRIEMRRKFVEKDLI